MKGCAATALYGLAPVDRVHRCYDDVFFFFFQTGFGGLLKNYCWPRVWGLPPDIAWHMMQNTHCHYIRHQINHLLKLIHAEYYTHVNIRQYSFMPPSKNRETTPKFSISKKRGLKVRSEHWKVGRGVYTHTQRIYITRGYLLNGCCRYCCCVSQVLNRGRAQWRARCGDGVSWRFPSRADYI